MERHRSALCFVLLATPGLASALSDPSTHDPDVLLARTDDHGRWFDLAGALRIDALASSTEGRFEDDASRALYVPGDTPIGGADRDAFDVHAKFSNISFAGGIPLGRRHAAALVELDFFGGDPEQPWKASAGYDLTVRHAFVAVDRWLVGRTWSNFMDRRSLPESVDLAGASDGAAWLRQWQLRYARGPWSISLEQPETTINPIGGGTRFTSDDVRQPDIVVRHTRETRWGHWSAAALVREFETETPTGTDDIVAVAASVSARYEWGDADDFRIGITAGQGFGRYVGLGASVDANIEPDGELEEVEGFAGYAGWRHVFDERWRANLYYSRAEWDNEDEVSGGLVIDHTHSLAANLIFAPTPALQLGLEARVAERVREDEAKGRMERLHLVVRYAF